MQKAPLFIFFFLCLKAFISCSSEKEELFGSKDLQKENLQFKELWDSLYVHVDSNTDSILFYADKINTLAKAENNTEWQAKSNKAFGFAHYENGNYKESTSYYLTAAKLFKESGDLYNVADIYNNIGSHYLETNDYNTAISFFNQAKDIYQYEGKGSDKAMVYRNLAICYKKLKLHKEAEGYLELGKKAAVNARDYDNLSWIYNTWGAINFEQQHYGKAVDYYHLAIQYADSFQHSDGIKSMTYNNLGEAYFFAGNTKEAKIWLHKAITAKKKLGDPVLCQTSYNLLAQLLIKEEKYHESIALLEESLQNISPDAMDQSISENLSLINTALLKINEEADPSQYSYLNKMMATYSQKLLAYNSRVFNLEKEMRVISQHQAMEAAVERYAFNEQLAESEASQKKLRYAFLIPILFLLIALVAVYMVAKKNKHYKKLYSSIEHILNNSKALRHLK